MSHPKDRRDRFLKGKHLGEKRARGLYSSRELRRNPESFEKASRVLRDTTKLCGRPCCANPRHNGWNQGLGKLTRQELKFEEKIKIDL